MKNWSLRTKLNAFPVLAVIALLLLAVPVYLICKEALEKVILKPMTRHAENMHTRIAGVIEEKKSDLIFISSTPLLKAALTVEYGFYACDEISTILSAYLKQKKYLSYIAVVDKSGKVVFSTDKNLLDVQCAKTDWFVHAGKYGKSFLSGFKKRENSVLLSRIIGADNFTIEISCPVFDDRNAFIGVIQAAVEWSKLVMEMEIGVKQLYHEIGIESGYGFIISGNGTVAAHPDPALVGREAGAAGLGSLYERLRTNGKGVFRYGSSDIPKTAGFFITPGFETAEKRNWIFGVGADDREIFSPIRTIQRITLILGISSLILIIWICLGILKGIITPINSLIEGINRMAAGDYESKVEVRSKDEIGRMAAAFNDMAEKIREYGSNMENRVRERTAELEKAYQDLKRMDEMKSTFLSTVSHELRTPLTSVLGFAKIIRNKLEKTVFPVLPEDDPKVRRTRDQIRENVEIIIAEGDRLTTLINDVLDLAKMEAGKIEWKRETVIISEIIERAFAVLSALFERKGLEARMEVEPGLPVVTGDRDRLIQVLVNLLSNAIKFTDSGSVVCQAGAIPGAVKISVIDTGIGISPEDHKLIFEKFKQVGDTLTDRPAGTGLGLPICRQIVESHGGEIDVESNRGAGSVFSFTLPYAGSPECVVHDGSPGGLSVNLRKHAAFGGAESELTGRKKVLIVDDDPSIRKLLKEEIDGLGCAVIEAENGAMAVDTAKREKPDLIVLDVMMPVMSGYDAAAIIKNDPALSKIPIIIHSVLEDAERGYNIGIDGYYPKSGNMEEMLDGIKELLSRGVSGKKIMVLDEGESILKRMADILRYEGYSFLQARSCDELMRKAFNEKPDVIILDVRLKCAPEVVESLKTDKDMTNVRFLFVSGDELHEKADFI